MGGAEPAAGLEVIDRLRTELAESSANYLLAAEAVVRLFTGGCVEVIDLAQRILAADPDPHQRVRALTCLTGALAFADRGAQAIDAGQQLLDALSETRVSATRAGLAYALVAVTGVFYGVEYRLPRPVGMSGRWPGEPERLEPQAARAAASAADPDADPAMDLGWPFLVGLKRHFAGDLAGAVGALREAYVQQQAGEGLFRSEATAELVIVLAELGEVDEAVAIMRDHPPDEVAIIPGLRPWAQSAVEAATGHHARATSSAIEAAQTAARHGAAAMAMNFLTDAARYGDAREAAAVLPTLGLPLDTPVQQVRAADVMARAQRDPQVLIAAAEAQLAAGFNRHAFELAELARAADEHGRHERPIAAVLRRARERLGRTQGSAAALAPSPLTQRETEVTRLAGRGLSDREIAEDLVLVHSYRAEPPGLCVPQARHRVTKRAQVVTGFGADSRGLWCNDSSPGTVARLARAGFDWVALDLQHGLYSRTELIEVARCFPFDLPNWWSGWPRVTSPPSGQRWTLGRRR